jgi:hypothetical protein
MPGVSETAAAAASALVVGIVKHVTLESDILQHSWQLTLSDILHIDLVLRSNARGEPPLFPPSYRLNKATFSDMNQAIFWKFYYYR